jgi:hypothetical protein
MITFIFMRTEAGTWSPRTSFHDNMDGAKRRLLPLVKQDFENEAAPISKRYLFVYFHSSGATDGSVVPEAKEFEVKMVEPVLIEVNDSSEIRSM